MIGGSISYGKLFDIHIDDVDSVLAIRARCLQLISEGKTIIEWTGEGTSAKKSFTLPVEQVLIATTQYLKEYDPATYGYPLRTMKVFRA